MFFLLFLCYLFLPKAGQGEISSGVFHVIPDIRLDHIRVLGVSPLSMMLDRSRAILDYFLKVLAEELFLQSAEIVLFQFRHQIIDPVSILLTFEQLRVIILFIFFAFILEISGTFLRKKRDLPQRSDLFCHADQPVFFRQFLFRFLRKTCIKLIDLFQSLAPIGTDLLIDQALDLQDLILQLLQLLLHIPIDGLILAVFEKERIQLRAQVL